MQLKAYDVQLEKKGQATLEDFAQYLQNDDSAEYVISLTQLSSLIGTMPDLSNAKRMYVTYQGFEFIVDENLKIEYIGSKASVSTGGTGNGVTGGGTIEGVGDISAAVTITDIYATKFTINVNSGEDESKIALYQYYVNGELLYQGPEKSYKVTRLKRNTNYTVEVKIIPKTTISLGTLQQKTSEAPIVEFSNQFDSYIYVDSNNGNDSTGNGSMEAPFKTLDKVADSGLIQRDNSYGVILNSGTYQLTTKMFNLDYNKEINIIGKRQDTILQVSSIYPNYSGGKTGYKINLYRLVWNGTSNDTNTIYPQIDMNFYNVVFKMNFSYASFSYFMSQSKIFNFYNCVLTQKVTEFLRNTPGQNKLTNCYGGFTSGYGTTNQMWDYQTNYITDTPKLNSTTYEITEDDDSVWKNAGTGENLDETVANIGVYGGQYSWEFDDDI